MYKWLVSTLLKPGPSEEGRPWQLTVWEAGRCNGKSHWCSVWWGPLWWCQITRENHHGRNVCMGECIREDRKSERRSDLVLYKNSLPEHSPLTQWGQYRTYLRTRLLGLNYVPLGSTSYRFYHLKTRLPTQGPFRTSINTAAHEKAFDIFRAGSRKPNYSESPLDTGMTLAEVRRRCWRRGRVWKNWMPVHYWLECKVVWQPRETGIFLKVKNIHLLWPRNSNPGY